MSKKKIEKIGFFAYSFLLVIQVLSICTSCAKYPMAAYDQDLTESARKLVVEEFESNAALRESVRESKKAEKEFSKIRDEDDLVEEDGYTTSGVRKTNNNEKIDDEYLTYENENETENESVALLNTDKGFIGTQIFKNQPDFKLKDYDGTTFENYSELDSLGRTGVAEAMLGKETMPTTARESIGSIKPAGWKTVKYDNVDGKYLFNRCHLIGWQLSAENANEKNLFTGTRYLNTIGMLPYENLVADYIKSTGNHVLYRVTPHYNGNDLIPNNIQMEAMSYEDNGAGVCFNVKLDNIQPNININYANGDSFYEDKAAIEGGNSNEA